MEETSLSSQPTLRAEGGCGKVQKYLGSVPVAMALMGHSPTEHEDVVEQGLLRQGDHLLQAQLLTAPIEAI